MTVIDNCLERIAHLDRADHLLSQMRMYGHRMPMREAMAQHRAMLDEARRLLDSATALCHGAA